MNDPSPFGSAFALHAAGKLAEAEAAYRAVLAAAPQHVEALHCLGVLLHQCGKTAEGMPLILRALDLDAGSASRCNDLGNVLVQVGDLANAATAFRLALQLD
ncbi:MAG: tetratricopeptide repeat protein, partial [Rhodocyclales bacterium]|nr:tetratricopeptide repeat protein [Rhodocyclales bacterium]